ncbi:hypothetical protein AB0H12_35435 [Actinosynnema sp. NPDC023794]
MEVLLVARQPEAFARPLEPEQAQRLVEVARSTRDRFGRNVLQEPVPLAGQHVGAGVDADAQRPARPAVDHSL